MNPVVEAISVTRRFRGRAGEVTVLDGVDLALVPGRLTALLGPSQSGKTTFVHLLAGWDTPDGGHVEWRGARTPPSWGEMAVVPQRFALLEELTVAENIGFPARVGSVGPLDDVQVETMLGELGIADLRDRLPSQISVGERQRTLVARALAAQPACILADEPTAHQDDGNAGVVLGLLRAAASAGTACLVATRANRAVRAIADDVVALG